MTRRDRSPDDRALGIYDGITRRDFLNATLLGAGAGLLSATAPFELLGRDL